MGPTGTEEPHATSVLLVEDDPDLHKVVALYLTRRGLHVLHAPDGKRALEQAVQHQPDVIITDLFMPDMGGGDLVEALRKVPELAHTPFIVTSAAFFNERDASSFKRRYQVGAVFQKPVPLQKLAETALQLGREYRQSGSVMVPAPAVSDVGTPDE